MTRRFKPKADALAGRKLAEGTQPGTALMTAPELDRIHAAIMSSGNEDPCPPRGEIARSEVMAAQRDRALDLLTKLERIITATGGFLAPEDQDALREARALLVEHDRRVEHRDTWVDRG